MFPRSPLDWIASALTIVGAINWGLISFTGFNLIESLFGEDSAITNLTYGLTGLAGFFTAYRLYQDARVRRARRGSVLTSLFGR